MNLCFGVANKIFTISAPLMPVGTERYRASCKSEWLRHAGYSTILSNGSGQKLPIKFGVKSAEEKELQSVA